MTEDLSRFGRSFSRRPYAGEPINQCADESAMCWKLNHGAVDPSNSERVRRAELLHIQERLEELGCGTIDGKWVTSSAYKRLTDNAPYKYFSCNPYRGEKIEECIDVSAICWKLNHDVFNYDLGPQAVEERRITEYTCKKLGGIFIAGSWFTPEQADQPWFKRQEREKDAVNNHEILTLEMDRNVSVEGTLSIGFQTFFFEFKYMPETYYAPAYALPKDNNGDAKRIKGKTIRINEYIWDDERCGFKVTNWEIL